MNRLCRRLLHPCVLAAAFVLAVTAEPVRAALVDDFEGAASPAPWIFSNGPEYPGATGSLSHGTGHTGAGAHLAFNLSGGGNYVGATLWLPAPLTAGALQVWVRNPGGAHIQVRVNDSTGQTLQYSPGRPFEANVPGDWYLLTVSLGATTAHWGGSVNDGVVHGSITGVSILAQPIIAPVGAIDFDDVSLVATRSTLINPAATAVATPAVPDLFGSLGVEITHADATATGLDLAQWLGCHRVRTEMFWADVETHPGVYDFTWYDQLTANLKARKMQPHFILCYGNPVYIGADWFLPPRTPAAIQAFANFARAAAARYAGQGVHFEVWNEQDISTYWNPPSAAEYSALCQPAAAAVHAGDPSALVSSGGLAGLDLAFLDGMIADGALNNVDAVGIHPYRKEIPEGLADDLAEFRAILAQSFPQDAPPVWSTEAGYSSAWYGNGLSAANRTTQAKLGVRQVLTGLGLGLPVQIMFDLRDTGTNPLDTEQTFGIVDAAYGTKPLTTAIRTLCRLGKSHTFAGILASPQNSTHIFKFQGPVDTLLVLWSETAVGAGQTISFPRLPLSVVDYLGRTLPVTPDGQGNYSVLVSDAPVYASFASTGSMALAVKNAP